MQKFIVAFTLFALMAGAAFADSLYLRDGSVLRGAYIGYENGRFTFETGDGNREEFLAGRVLRLEIDREARSSDARFRRPERRSGADAASQTSSNAGRWESAAPFDVRLEDQWIRSEIQARKGDRIRVEASGTVTLEGQTYVSPEGLRNRRDPNALMPDENDGALIAVIGKDPDAPLIRVGRQLEFVADRDGMLYFTVNHGETRNSGGAFRVHVSVNRASGGAAISGRAGRTEFNQKVLTVPGNQAWVDTGIDLESAASLEIVAEGQIFIDRQRSTGPEGDRDAIASTAGYPLRNTGIGALLWKIRYTTGRDSRIFYAGARQQVKTGATEAGRLYLGINDNNLRDNSGSYRVTVRWQ